MTSKPSKMASWIYFTESRFPKLCAARNSLKYATQFYFLTRGVFNPKGSV